MVLAAHPHPLVAVLELAGDRVAMVLPAHPRLLVVVRELGLVFHSHGHGDLVAMVLPAHPRLLVVVRELGLVFHGHGHGDRVSMVLPAHPRLLVAVRELALQVVHGGPVAMVLPAAHPRLLVVVRELALAVHGKPTAVALGIRGRGRGGDGVEDGVELRDVLGPGRNRRRSAPAVLRGGAPLRELEVLAHGIPAADVAVGLGSERGACLLVEGDGECDLGVIGARRLGGQPRLHLRRPRALRGGDGWREEASGPGVEVGGGGGGRRESPATLHPRGHGAEGVEVGGEGGQGGGVGGVGRAVHLVRTLRHAPPVAGHATRGGDLGTRAAGGGGGAWRMRKRKRCWGWTWV
jgi:hypothetical protein